jgi:hypothetical protein
MTVRNMNLVAPLAHEATAMHTTDTSGLVSGRSGAVAQVIGSGLRLSDVDSAIKRPSARTSTMAIRTTTTSTTTTWCAPSADSSGYTFESLLQAYLDCRRHKRNTGSALEFEQNLERNLYQLHKELESREYEPGRSICFVVTRPKAREVWAAAFRDRIVHHLLYNQISPYFYRRFIADTCACIPGRGTLYGIARLESKIRSITHNWSKPAFYLKCDISNFFVSIDKSVLWQQLLPGLNTEWLTWLCGVTLFHDPRTNYEYQGDPARLNLVPPHKRLTNQKNGWGLPIGNLSSQFFANVYLDALDQFAKHQLGARHYIRYVDDFVLLHESAQWLNNARVQIEEFLPARLGVQLNPKKTILQPVDRGVDFVGQVIKPWHRTVRARTRNEGLRRTSTISADNLFETANSYFGLFRQATHSHSDRVVLANLLRARGHAVKGDLTKTYRRST